VGSSGSSLSFDLPPPHDLDELFAQIPSMEESEPSIPAPVGTGTQPLDYADRNQALFAVAIIQQLPPGITRENLIQQYGFTKDEIQAMRQQYSTVLSARGQAPSPFPAIQWAPSPIRPVTASTPVGVRRQLIPPSPPTPSSPSSSSSNSSDPSTPSRSNLLDRFDDVTDQVRRAARGPGRRVRNITHTNTVTTVYEEDPNGTPLVRRTSTRNGPGRRSRNSSQSRGSSDQSGGYYGFLFKDARPYLNKQFIRQAVDKKKRQAKSVLGAMASKWL